MTYAEEEKAEANEQKSTNKEIRAPSPVVKDPVSAIFESLSL